MEKKQSKKDKELKKFNKTIKPFLIIDHGNTYALILTENSIYEKILFLSKTNKLISNGYDWNYLMQTFVADKMPELTHLLDYDSEAGMFCIYYNDLPCLMNLVEKFKATCDDQLLFKDLISRTEFLTD